MIKKFNDFLNEDFTDLYKRWKEKETRKEDSLEIKMKDFISSRENPQYYYIENGLVCCKGNVDIKDGDLVNGKFLFKFGKVDGYFDCSWCKELTSLEGAPKEVKGDFYGSYCGKEFTKSDLPKGTIIKGNFKDSWEL